MNINLNIDAARKKLLIKISVVFLVVLLLLTFLSNTINNFSLPRVKTQIPTGGALNIYVSAEGNIEAKEVEKKYSQSSREVLEVYAKVGSEIKKGDPIMKLDKGDLQASLEQELIQLEKLKLALEKSQGSTTDDSLVNSKRALLTAKENQLQAESNLKSIKELYDEGAETKANLDKAQKEYDAAKKDNQYKQEDYDNAVKAGQKRDEDRKIDIENYQLDIKLQQIKVDNIKKELAEDINIVAPCNGIIKEIGFEKGTLTNPGTALFSIVDESKGFQFRASVDTKSLMRLKLKDLAKVTLKNTNRTLEGNIVEIKENSKNSSSKDIIISLPQEDIAVEEIGEIGDVRVDIASDNYEFLVPNSAIGDDGKKFVYILKEKKGTLGNEYYAKKAYVNVKDQDNSNSGILSGLEQNEKIIVTSSKSNLSDGCRVMLER